jgi:hypothetical protein
MMVNSLVTLKTGLNLAPIGRVVEEVLLVEDAMHLQR